jgi:hypothetical protein
MSKISYLLAWAAIKKAAGWTLMLLKEYAGLRTK